GGLLTVRADGTLDFDPNGEFTGLPVGQDAEITVEYTIEDPAGLTDMASVTIVVSGVNDRPVAADDTGLTDEITPIDIDVTANDTDADEDALFVLSLDDTATLGSVSINPDGTIAYDPNGAFDSLEPLQDGTDSFDYTVSDGRGGTDTGTVTVTINGRNTPPDVIGYDDATDQDSAIAGSGLGEGTSDPDGGTSVLADVSGDAGLFGQAVVGSNGGLFTVNADGTYQFDPNGDFDALPADDSATTSVTLGITDGQGGRSETALSVVVRGLNDAPVAGDDSFAVLETETLVGSVFVANDGTADRDVDNGDTFTVTAMNGVAGDVGSEVTLTSGALLTLAADGSFDYDPNGSFLSLGEGEQGSDSFTSEIRDSAGAPSEATVTITIDGVDQRPDLVATGLTAPTSGIGEQGISIGYTLENIGTADAVGGFVERVYFSSDAVLDAGDTLVRELSFGADLVAGGSFARTATLDLPDASGEFFLLVSVDDDAAIAELVETNNVTASAAISMVSEFTASVTGAPETSPIGDAFTISGTTSSRLAPGGASFEFVTIDAEIGGVVQSFSALTDINGNFSFDYTPQPGIGGTLSLNARSPVNPGEDAVAEQTVELFGFVVAETGTSASVIEGQSVEIDVTLENLGAIALSGIEASLVGLEPGLNGVVAAPAVLAAGA
ncbi:MAG: Ig-like domain-containing protein, partial [Pseudomonadota bacterium]